MVISFPLAFAGTFFRTGTPIPDCFLEFPPQDCLIPKAPYSWCIYLLLFLGGCAFFFVLLIFPCCFPPAANAQAWFHVNFAKRIYKQKNERETTGGSFPLWAVIGFPMWFFFWWAQWAQPAWFGDWIHFTFVPLWVGFILSLDSIVYFRQGHSMLSKNAAAVAHVFILSGVGWLYFEFMGYFTQNWYYPINKVWSEKGYIVWYLLCYMTIFPALFEWADLLHTFKYFRVSWSNGPKINLPRWFQVIVLAICGYGCYMSAKSPYASLWFAFAWLSPAFFAGFGLTLVKYPNPFSIISYGDYGSLVIYGMSGLFNGLCWEIWNSRSLPSNPSYWKYDIPYLNAWHIGEMPLVGFLGYIPFGVCCWAMWLVALAIVNPPRPLTWRDAWIWLVVGLILYFRVFYLAEIIKHIFSYIVNFL